MLTWNVKRDLEKDRDAAERKMLRKRHGMGYHKLSNIGKQKSGKFSRNKHDSSQGIGDLLSGSGLLGGDGQRFRTSSLSASAPDLLRPRTTCRPNQSQAARRLEAYNRPQTQGTYRIADPWGPETQDAELPAVALLTGQKTIGRKMRSHREAGRLGGQRGYDFVPSPGCLGSHQKLRHLTRPPGKIPMHTLMQTVGQNGPAVKKTLSSHVTDSFIFGKSSDNSIEPGDHNHRLITTIRPGEVSHGSVVTAKVGDCKVLRQLHSSQPLDG